MVKYLKGRNIPVSDLEGGVNIESDCEGDSQEVKQETSKDWGETEERTRAVLIAGSFSAYRFSYSVLSLTELKNLSGGSPFFSTVVQTRSRSLPSSPKVSTPALIIFARRQWPRRPLLARRRAYMFWLAW